MTDTVLVNLHCHTIFSDGEQTPEVLAANLAAAGVRYAALTDHNTLIGLPRFQDALQKRGVAHLTGVEVTTWFRGREAHLLGYGFDPQNAALDATLFSLRQVRNLEVHSIASSLRRIGAGAAAGRDEPPGISAAPDGWLEIGDAIDLLHQAGGRAFWAHPLVFESDPERLDAYVAELKTLGLDGLEAIYAPFSAAEREQLCQLAAKHDLLVSAGTDFHAENGLRAAAWGIPMPRADWVRFRKAVFHGASAQAEAAAPQAALPGPAPARGPSAAAPHQFRRRSFILRIFLPTLIAIAVLLAAIWGITLPSFERTLLDRKRELIRELTNSAWSILASYERDERNGLLTREQAQELAKTRVEALRYGPEGKDYFWIQDLQPRMIMHPYRGDLSGEDVSAFVDARGVPIFVQFANLVRRSGEGYVDYVWQWNDDPERLAPKESYVKGFEPWGWVIGTGIYTDDVNAEIARIERGVVYTSLLVSSAVVFLLLFVLQQSLRIERQRQAVVDSLGESTERYHSLVEATTEGTLLVLDDRCRYANPTFLGMLGYTAPQLEFLELADVLPHEPDNAAIWARLRGENGAAAPADAPLEGCLARQDGSLMECLLALNPIQFAGQRGFILLAKDLARQPAIAGDDGLAAAAQAAPVGIFRARAVRRGVFVEINEAGRALLPRLPAPENAQPALADLFAEPAEYEQFVQALQAEGEIRSHGLHVETGDAASRAISLSARLTRDEQGRPAYIVGLLEDVTATRRQEAGRAALIDRLQASFLFLHEPLASLGRDAVICPLDTGIAQLATLMTERQVTAALVTSERGAIIGIVTDHDLRARVLAGDADLSAPVHTIMSSPLTRIPESALMYEALMRMEEKGVRHLAVEDRNGEVVSVIDSKSLVQFPRYGPMVLAREIGRAETPDGVAQHCGRVAPLAKSLLDSSARPRHVTHMLTSICDAATARLIELAVAELGPPPAPFAFIAMGSQGRQEQTLLTDQDNGIIYAPAGDADPQAVGDYFLRLGAQVCDGLERAGYTLCRGKVMASNPRWCRSLPDWIRGFNEWWSKSEPQEITDFSIFFDFRTVYGDADLTHALRGAIHTSLRDQSAFFHLFAQNALLFKPPFRLLGNIYLSGGATEHAGEINLKDAMMPVVSFARLYALRHQVNQTHTTERIDALAERGIILPASRDEIVAAYDFLMELRLGAQLAAIQAGRPAQNVIHPGKLGHIQRELLKQAFAQIAAVQKKVSYEFLGGV
jgi:PAS domain S-box-containing protein